MSDIPQKWLDRYVDVRNSIAFYADLETLLIENNVEHAPQPVCLQYAWEGEDPTILSFEHDREEIVDIFTEVFSNPQVTCYGWNFGFDICVLHKWLPELRELMWDALEAGRVFDCMLLETLIDIRYGKYNQEGQCKFVYEHSTGKMERYGYSLFDGERLHRFPDVELHDKGVNSWKLRYGELLHTPVSEYPEDAWLYAVLDVYGLRHVRNAQLEILDLDDRADFSTLHLCAEETFKAAGLIQSSNVSFHTDEVRFVKLRDRLLLELNDATQALSEPIHAPGTCPTPSRPVCERCKAVPKKKGDVWVCPTCGVAMKAACMHRLVEPPRQIMSGKNAGELTKSKKSTKLLEEVVRAAALDAGESVKMANEGSAHVSTEAKYLLKFALKNPVLAKQVTYNQVSKVVTTYLDILPLGFHGGIKYSTHTLLGTGRCSVSDPPLQQLPRKGGVRECLVGCEDFPVIVSCDYGTLELRTLAQSALWLVGWSNLAKALNDGMDVHVLLASDVLELSYEDAVLLYEDGDELLEEWRQLCKIGNFGFGGFMQPETFVDYCLGYGKVITLETAERIYASFLRRWAEMKDVFAYVRRRVNSGRKQITLPSPPNGVWCDGLTKGNLIPTAGANLLFQGPAARGAKLAHARAVRECYAVPSSPLYGNAVPRLFAHDELLFGVRQDPLIVTACAKRIQAIMIETMTEVVSPDVTITADPVAMSRWIKGAKPVWKNGLLMLTQEKEKAVSLSG